MMTDTTLQGAEIIRRDIGVYRNMLVRFPASGLYAIYDGIGYRSCSQRWAAEQAAKAAT